MEDAKIIWIASQGNGLVCTKYTLFAVLWYIIWDFLEETSVILFKKETICIQCNYAETQLVKRMYNNSRNEQFATNIGYGDKKDCVEESEDKKELSTNNTWSRKGAWILYISLHIKPVQSRIHVTYVNHKVQPGKLLLTKRTWRTNGVRHDG